MIGMPPMSTWRLSMLMPMRVLPDCTMAGLNWRRRLDAGDLKFQLGRRGLSEHGDRGCRQAAAD